MTHEMRVEAFALRLAIATAVAGCTSWLPPTGPTLTFLAGQPAAEPAAAECSLAGWSAPWGKVERMCLDPSTRIEATRREISGFRIEDRKFGDQTWHLVSVYLSVELYKRLWHEFGDDRPYAVFADDELSVVMLGFERIEYPSRVAATRDLSKAESFVSAVGAPVERWISVELDSQAVQDVSLVQLIANPRAWAGKRVSVQGYLAPLHALFLSREHAKAFDVNSSIPLVPWLPEIDFDPFEDCQDTWVMVEGFVDLNRGAPELVRL
jgi:hypothetical protein